MREENDTHNQNNESLPSLYQQKGEQFQPYTLVPYKGPTETPNSTADREPSVTDIFKVLAKRKKAVFASIVGIFTLAAIYVSMTPYRYSATVGIEIQGYAPVLATAQMETMYGIDTRKLDYQKTTTAKLMRKGLADKVLGRNNLGQEVSDYFENQEGFIDGLKGTIKNYLQWILLGSASEQQDSPQSEDDHHYNFREGLINSYLNIIDVVPVHETSIVEVTATTTDPKLSQHIVNSHAEQFIEQLRSERQGSVQNNLKVLQKQADELKEKVVSAEKKLADYAETHELFAASLSPNSGGGDNLQAAHVADLNKQLTDATSRRIRSESMMNQLENRSMSDLTSLDNETIRDLKVQLKQAEAEYATLGQKVTPLYPSMMELKAKIDSLRSLMQGERKQLFVGLRTQYDSDKATEQKLLAQIEAEKLKAHEMAKRMVQYGIIEREVQSLRDLYQAIMKQMKETEVSAASQGSNVIITDYAALPQKPSGPKSNAILIVSLILGAVVGIGLAFLLEALDNTIATIDDIQTTLGLPALGIVPSFISARELSTSDHAPQGEALYVASTDEENGATLMTREEARQSAEITPGFVTISSPNTAVSEALRTIRASILLSAADNPYRVVLVTSSNKGEGKTTLASNLAITLAQASHKTLLIDCDLRQSKVESLFAIEKGRPGLVDLLAGQASIQDIVCRSSVESLDLITAGPVPPNPAELIGSQKMGHLIKLLKDHYDYILLDAPPVMPVADSLMLSRLVDGVILVVRSGNTEKAVAQETFRRLRRVRGRIIGVVLNDVDAQSEEYGSHANNEYYVDSLDRKKAVGF